VPVFGAWVSKNVWKEVSRTLPWLNSRMADCSVELVAAGASGDLAYTGETGFRTRDSRRVPCYALPGATSARHRRVLAPSSHQAAR